MNLSSRQEEYQSVSDISLTKRLPVIIRCDGKNFSRVTRKAEKPYDPLIQDCMSKAMLFAVADMQGAVFAYTQSDEITFILRNDQSLDSEPWFQNRIQKISSIASSLVTYGFSKAFNELPKKPSLQGDLLFDTRVFVVPSIIEAVNNLIWRQKDCLRNAIALASQVELSVKVGKKNALNTLYKKSSKEKLEILRETCGVNFEEVYPAGFRYGVGAYKIPTIINKELATIRNQWYTNWNLPFFLEEKDFIMNILLNGQDIIRPLEVIKEI